MHFTVECVFVRRYMYVVSMYSFHTRDWDKWVGLSHCVDYVEETNEYESIDHGV